MDNLISLISAVIGENDVVKTVSVSLVIVTTVIASAIITTSKTIRTIIEIRFQKAQTRPRLIADLDHKNVSPSCNGSKLHHLGALISLIIKNVGKGPAYDISFSLKCDKQDIEQKKSLFLGNKKGEAYIPHLNIGSYHVHAQHIGVAINLLFYDDGKRSGYPMDTSLTLTEYPVDTSPTLSDWRPCDDGMAEHLPKEKEKYECKWHEPCAVILKYKDQYDKKYTEEIPLDIPSYYRGIEKKL